MEKPKKCPNCQGELTTKQVEKLLKGGVNTAIVQVEAEVCLKCGERLYKPKVVRQFAQIRAKLKNQETKDFELIGQSFSVRSLIL
ncbi:YgiT-type zinc finger protein [Crocosphaera sp. XPORK-15E]|uniref:YgiT-type zinc finger protein n=1 Tax=Crocosphaera sp. XPORK-15E TaxID=3110247 RepID=UPI002B2046B4|nr:YgiT-type zinc finger protein [Crocosphaera sp. XPORK-15E]MEA5536148.1 YgiT-type zinc finger protein [Crocosphaera sp. XPORK-15E]